LALVVVVAAVAGGADSALVVGLAEWVLLPADDAVRAGQRVAGIAGETGARGGVVVA
jgi:hypothetical protein